MSPPDPSPVIDLMEAFRRSKAMFAAVELGVFDRLAEHAMDAKTLAVQTRAHPDALERLLDACVGLGFLEKQGSTYSCALVAETYLRRSSCQALAGYILYSNRVLYSMWGNLENAVREGSHRWSETFHFEASIFDHFFNTEQSKRDFLAGMHGLGLLSSPRVVAAFDLRRFSRLVDLGGGTGHLALAACEQYPRLQAAVFDLPAVFEVAKEILSRSPHAHRVELLAGDFFTDPLPEADLFSLGRIVHDWSEEKIRALLSKIHDRLPSGGACCLRKHCSTRTRTVRFPL